MFKNYLVVAFRNLWRHKAFSLINILGLAVGITASFLIFLYVRFESGYDSFNSKADRIYRIVTDVKTPSETIHTGSTTAPIAINLVKDFPEVEDVVRLNMQSLLVRRGNIKYEEERTVLADSSLFNIFDFPLVYGNKNHALKEPMSIVMSETAAKKYFGDINPVGQQVLLTGDGINATVTAVMKDLPANSHLKADMFVSLSSYKQIYKYGNPDSEWANFNFYSYILLRPHASASTIQEKLAGFMERHDGKQMKELQMYYTLFLEPLRDVYLKSKRDGFETGNVNNVYIFSVIAGFILLIACINFINLTTARSTERAREVGIRKVVGALRVQLTKQFMGESVIICFVAFTIAVLLAALFLPLFNHLAGKEISTPILYHPWYILSLFFIAATIGVVAGSYPSLVLSSFKPSIVLKGRFTAGKRGLQLRKGLVIFQFTISIILITGTIVVYKQLAYMRKQDLGFNKEQMLIVDTKNDKNKDALKQALSSVPGVLAITSSSSIPGSSVSGAYSQVQNKAGDMQKTNLDVYFVDYDYISQYEMQVVAGRRFSRALVTDRTQAMIINESAARLLGYTSPQEAIGRNFDQWGRQGKIIGVIKDFHHKALQEPIKPLTMRIEQNNLSLISIKMATENLPATIMEIQKEWNRFIPARPFSYYFLDEFFDRQYRGEERFGKLFLNFAILAIFISCLGLLGLASYSTIQRTKEIGVRKVMGATVSNIVNLLSIDFMKLVVIALVLASPIAWLGMHLWLSDFAYRTNMSWLVFALAGGLALIIAFFAISVQAVKAALKNPVVSLKTE